MYNRTSYFHIFILFFERKTSGILCKWFTVCFRILSQILYFILPKLYRRKFACQAVSYISVDSKTSKEYLVLVMVKFYEFGNQMIESVLLVQRSGNVIEGSTNSAAAMRWCLVLLDIITFVFFQFMERWRLLDHQIACPMFLSRGIVFLEIHLSSYKLNASRSCSQSYSFTSQWRPLRLQEVEASRISRQSAREGVKVVSPKRSPPLLPDWVDPRSPVRSEGWSQWKFPTTPSRIEPATC